jgi:hypothetical protein
VIEFVSPRPNEYDENDIQSASFGGGNITGGPCGLGNYIHFKEIQEEIKEEDEISIEGSRVSNLGGVEEYKKQLSSRKFTLF